ncbi:MAG: AraC family transcriptional regulator [Chitinophagaceae bacterium]
MDKPEDFFFLLVFFSGMLGGIVAFILCFVNQTNSYSSRLLAGFLITFSLFAVNFSLMTTTFFTKAPYLWRAVGFASFCYAPLAYLYVRSVLQQSYRFRKVDLLLFIPALLHPISFIPFFLKPTSEKIEFIRLVAKEPYRTALEEESFMPPGTYYFIRVIMGVVLLIYQVVLLRKWKRKHGETMLKEQQNQDMFRWLVRFTIVIGIYWLLIVTESIYHAKASGQLVNSLIFTISGTIFFVCLYLMMQPSILYGIKGWRQPKKSESTVVEQIPEPVQDEKESKRHYLSLEQGQHYKELLERHIHTQEPFRKTGYSLTDLSHELQIPPHQLSAFINQEYARNFSELINGYRVDYLIRRSRETDDFDQFTLEGISKEAGFNSRATFISAVKRHTGKTPSELFRSKLVKEG